MVLDITSKGTSCLRMWNSLRIIASSRLLDFLYIYLMVRIFSEVVVGSTCLFVPDFEDLAEGAAAYLLEEVVLGMWIGVLLDHHHVLVKEDRVLGRDLLGFDTLDAHLVQSVDAYYSYYMDISGYWRERTEKSKGSVEV